VDKLVAANKKLWDELAAVHAESKFYDVQSFLAGKSSLKRIELEELGDIAGKSLLHMQCHFGMDSLSLARLGARVTGLDFSGQAIELARSLNTQLGLSARFVESDVAGARTVIEEQFDIVFTSYGVLVWLPDLKAWAKSIADCLKPGGMFLLVEEHPFTYMLEQEADRLEIKYSYFEREPIELPVSGSYADPEARIEQPVTYEWVHTISEVITSLIGAGLTIESLREFPFCMYRKFNSLVEDEDGYFQSPDHPGLPLLYSLRARLRI